MNRYDSYKDSGVEWIGEIPTEWEKSPIKHYYDYKKGSRGQELTKTYIQEHPGEYPVYSGQTVNEGVLGKIDEYEFDFPDGVIFTTTVGMIMSTKVLKDKFSLSQNCLIMIPKKEVNTDFVNYFLSVDWMFRKLQFPKIIQPSLRMEDIDQYHFYLPPLKEQHQIVSYLDNKTSSIDSLIQSKEKKIELLKEKRTSLINQVVTEGLNPDVEMKDSGVEWIGLIPREWEKTKIKYLISKKPDNGLFKKREEFGDGIPFINVSDLFSNDGIIDENKLELVRVTPKEIDKSLVMDGDIFFVRSSLKLEGIGVSSIYLGGSVLVFDCHIIRVTPNKVLVNPKFLIFLLNSRIYRNSLISLSETVTMTTISQDKIKDLVVCIPPLSEQQEIVSYLDKETKLIDETISLEQKKIELLKEYKQSLISEVVTGKRKVVLN